MTYNAFDGTFGGTSTLEGDRIPFLKSHGGAETGVRGAKCHIPGFLYCAVDGR